MAHPVTIKPLRKVSTDGQNIFLGKVLEFQNLVLYTVHNNFENNNFLNFLTILCISEDWYFPSGGFTDMLYMFELMREQSRISERIALPGELWF